MRRILSILLVLVLGLPLFASAFADAQGSTIPLCCRRGGAHHCMGMDTNPTNAPVVRAVCPAFPRAASSVPSSLAMLLTQPPDAATYAIASASTAEADGGYRIALLSPRWQRGPPTQN